MRIEVRGERERIKGRLRLRLRVRKTSAGVEEY